MFPPSNLASHTRLSTGTWMRFVTRLGPHFIGIVKLMVF
jgi:hypothetical protein